MTGMYLVIEENAMFECYLLACSCRLLVADHILMLCRSRYPKSVPPLAFLPRSPLAMWN